MEKTDRAPDAPPILDAQTYQLPAEPGYSWPITTVVLIGQPGAYLARVGHGSAAWVADSGRPLPLLLAREVFPDWPLAGGEYLHPEEPHR